MGPEAQRFCRQVFSMGSLLGFSEGLILGYGINSGLLGHHPAYKMLIAVVCTLKLLGLLAAWVFLKRMDDAGVSLLGQEDD